MPVVVTKLRRVAKRDANGNPALDCDHAEGFFTRAIDFTFVVGFAGEPGADTYRGTRIRAIHISERGLGYWSWAMPPFEKKNPDCQLGRRLLSDLLGGIDAAIRAQHAHNKDYCVAVFECAVRQLLALGIDPAIIGDAMRDSLARAEQREAARPA